MFFRKNHWHTGMDLRDELVRLTCDNRASAQPLSRCGISPIFPERESKRASVFHGDCKRQLRFSRFAPFVKSIGWNQALPFCESPPERGRFIDGLSSGVYCPGEQSSDLLSNAELIPIAVRRANAAVFPD
jgi:hypothetical protein